MTYNAPLDEEKLRTLWATALSPVEIAQALGCHPSSLYRRADKLGLPPRGLRTGRPPVGDHALARELLAAPLSERKTLAEISKATGVRVDLLSRWGVAMGERRVATAHYLLWTEREIAQLRAQYGARTTPQIARALGRSEASVRSKASELGLTRKRTAAQGFLWTRARRRHLRILRLLLDGPKSSAQARAALGIRYPFMHNHPLRVQRYVRRVAPSPPYQTLFEITDAGRAYYEEHNGMLD